MGRRGGRTERAVNTMPYIVIYNLLLQSNMSRLQRALQVSLEHQRHHWLEVTAEHPLLDQHMHARDLLSDLLLTKHVPHQGPMRTR
jgi:hypothetical protein